MGDEEYALLSELIRDRFGLEFPSAQRDRVRFRLRHRLEARTMPSFLEYYRFLVLSQEAVALRASLHRTEISALERGLKEPRLKTILKVCAAVEAEPNELLAGMEWLPGSEVEGRFDIPEPGATL